MEYARVSVRHIQNLHSFSSGWSRKHQSLQVGQSLKRVARLAEDLCGGLHGHSLDVQLAEVWWVE
jgi:hypothetical protein